MKTLKLVFLVYLLMAGFNSCKKDPDKSLSALEKIDLMQYFDAEVFAEPDLKIYGKWQLFSVTGGFSGGEHELSFKFLEIKEYGIYAFVKNNSVLEFGRIAPALQTANESDLKVFFEKDEKSASFFGDIERRVVFVGKNELHLYAPCCDGYDFHLKRVN